jgi:RND family efflux transporter MFP subunit
VERERELDRVKARAASRLAQAEAQMNSAAAGLELARSRLEKVQSNIAKCTVRAQVPGQAIYGSRTDPPWYRTGTSALRPGANIEERRTLVRIPDPSALAVFLSIGEADIQKIEVGQPAVITLEAAPGRTFAGRVSKVSPVASTTGTFVVESEERVYETEIELEEKPDLFIPGMTADVEIIAAQLEDALHVPAQAVNSYLGNSICWVKGPERPEPRLVEVGHRSHTHVEIEAGLEEGEVVYLAPPMEMTEELLSQLGATPLSLPEAPSEPPIPPGMP